MNLRNIKKYSALFGAILSYISTLFYWNAISTQYSNPQGVSESYGAWFFLGATLSWVIYLFAYALQTLHSKKS